ncbi:hypothetical protein J4221_07480 [Candidatus Pacearchaeota archaeon]|nr:hypothetical protein [Candidatus Pacearchaeota archaeon]
MEKREWKNLIKYNLLSLFIFISSVLIGFAIAGNVFVTNGNVETDSGLNVSNILFVNASTKNVGIGISNPGHNLTVIGDINFTGKIYGDGSELTGVGNVSWNESRANDLYEVKSTNGSTTFKFSGSKFMVKVT